MTATRVDGFTYKAAPWEHQKAALEFLDDHPAALLDYEMGCGKTKITVDWIANQPAGIHIVICPKKVISVWESEFVKWSAFRYYLLPLSKSSETAKKKAARVDQFIKWNTPRVAHKVIVVNYESAWRAGLREVFLGKQWDTVVLDESHRIKDPQGRASKFCNQLGRKAVRRVCLSGTPLPHSPLDVFGQARFLDPIHFGYSYTRFRARYAVMGGYAVNGRPVQIVGYQNEDELTEKMRKFTIQARTDEVLDLPEAHHIEREIELGARGRKHYTEMERLFLTWVKQGEAVTAANSLVKLLRLQQITSGHLPDENDRLVEVDDQKREHLKEILEDLPPNEKVVVFCRFTADIQNVIRVAQELDRTPAELSGHANDLEKWKTDPKTTVLAAQLQAGKEGISLVEARYAVYYSLGYSLGDYVQSLARIRRPGQEAKRCTYYHLVAKGTIDRKVYQALSSRKAVVDSILDEVRDGNLNGGRA